MQDSVKKIIKKFKEHDPYHYSNNKQNCFKWQPSRDNCQTKDQIVILNKRILTLENTVDILVTDANRVIKHYQELLRQHIFNNQQVKEQFANFKLATIQDKKEAEAQVNQLNEKIEELKSQITKKQMEYLSLFQKYEDFEQCTIQLRKEDDQNLIQMQEKIRKQTFILEERISHSQFEANQAKNKLLNLVTKTEGLESENDFLKKLIEELIQENQDLKEKCLEQVTSRPLQRSKSIESECYLQYDFECLSKEDESRAKVQQIKMGESCQIQLNCQKEVLNISQHYSKYNRADQILSKEHSNYRFFMMNSNQSRLQKLQDLRRKTLKNKQVVSRLFSDGLVRINTGESEKSVPKYQPKESNINEVKEFKMSDNQESPTINPYKAFFQLMTQCEKMNSPYCWQVCNVDLSFLYDKLVSEVIPYNFWQSQIRKALECQIK